MAPQTEPYIQCWTRAARCCWGRFPGDDVDRVAKQLVPTTGREWVSLEAYLRDPSAFETCHLDRQWYNLAEAFGEYLEWDSLRRPQLYNLTGYVACGVVILFLRAGTTAAPEHHVMKAVIAATWSAVVGENSGFGDALGYALEHWPPVMSGGRDQIPAHCAAALTSRGDRAQRNRALESALESIDDWDVTMNAARAMILDVLRRV